MMQSDPAAEIQTAYFLLLSEAAIGCPMYDRVSNKPPTLYVTFDGVVCQPRTTKTSGGVDATVILTVWSSFEGGEGTKMRANEVADTIVQLLSANDLEIASGWYVVDNVWLDSSPAEDYGETRMWYRRIVRFQHNVEQA